MAGLKQVLMGRSCSILCWGALASHLKLKWCGPSMFQGALCLCHLDVMAGAVGSNDQVYPGVYCPVSTLVGQLGLVWARGLGFTEVADQLGHWILLTFMISRWRESVNHVSHQPPNLESSRSFSSIWQNSRAGSFIC